MNEGQGLARRIGSLIQESEGEIAMIKLLITSGSLSGNEKLSDLSRKRVQLLMGRPETGRLQLTQGGAGPRI